MNEELKDDGKEVLEGEDENVEAGGGPPEGVCTSCEG